jgi:hypothetical protein
MRKLITGAAGTIAFIGVANAATLIVDDQGILTGAEGVEVDGKFYDVSLVPENCDGAYDGCQEGNFDFTTAVEAELATQALLDQVFIDGPQGNFDTNFNRTIGCERNTSICAYRVAFSEAADGRIGTAIAINSALETGDANILATQPTNILNYARFELNNAEVPVPGAIGLMATGLAGSFVARRKRKA